MPWVKASAYTLYGLSPPWELEGGSIDAGFRTSESGQMLVNRCARRPEPTLPYPTPVNRCVRTG